MVFVDPGIGCEGIDIVKGKESVDIGASSGVAAPLFAGAGVTVDQHKCSLLQTSCELGCLCFDLVDDDKSGCFVAMEGANDADERWSEAPVVTDLPDIRYFRMGTDQDSASGPSALSVAVSPSRASLVRRYQSSASSGVAPIAVSPSFPN